MNFKKFNVGGNSEPKGWTNGLFVKVQEEDAENNEVPAPYEQDSDESDIDSETDVGEECEVSSCASSIEEKFIHTKQPRRTTFSYVVVLQEEDDFLPE